MCSLQSTTPFANSIKLNWYIRNTDRYCHPYGLTVEKLWQYSCDVCMWHRSQGLSLPVLHQVKTTVCKFLMYSQPHYKAPPQLLLHLIFCTVHDKSCMGRILRMRLHRCVVKHCIYTTLLLNTHIRFMWQSLCIFFTGSIPFAGC